MTERTTLVLVPGIGDDYDIYQTFAKRWARLGFEVHIISFGWIDRTVSFTAKLEVFLRKLDALHSRQIHLIGISAGGTAAIAALAERDYIAKVITVCSPLIRMDNLDNPLLQDGIMHTERYLKVLDEDKKARILSTFGVYDQTVMTKLSRPSGVRQARIFMVFHAPAIFVALTLQARSLARFFRK